MAPMICFSGTCSSCNVGNSTSSRRRKSGYTSGEIPCKSASRFSIWGRLVPSTQRWSVVGLTRTANARRALSFWSAISRPSSSLQVAASCQLLNFLFTAKPSLPIDSKQLHTLFSFFRYKHNIFQQKSQYEEHQRISENGANIVLMHTANLEALRHFLEKIFTPFTSLLFYLC